MCVLRAGGSAALVHRLICRFFHHQQPLAALYASSIPCEIMAALAKLFVSASASLCDALNLMHYTPEPS